MASKSKTKRASVATAQTLIGLVAMAATGIIIPHEHCRQVAMLCTMETIEVGLMLSGLKTLARLQKPLFVELPPSAWGHFLQVVTAAEVKYALAGGYAVGLVKGCCHLAGW